MHTSAVLGARQRLPTNIKLRRPIIPTIENLKTNESHPLYQFFSNKKLLRSTEEIQSSGRHWTIAELRRKSFEDLHALWYVVLKERNVLAREYKIMETISISGAELYEQQSSKLRETMWRIRFVLQERLQAQEKLQEHFKANRDQYLDEFKEEFLQSENVETEEWREKLERLQFAFFGISDEISLDLEIDVNYILGIRFVGDLLFSRFNQETDGISELRDITEHYAVFEEEPSLEGFQLALEKIREYRASGVKIPKNKDIVVIKALIENRIKQLS